MIGIHLEELYSLPRLQSPPFGESRLPLEIRPGFDAICGVVHHSPTSATLCVLLGGSTKNLEADVNARSVTAAHLEAVNGAVDELHAQCPEIGERERAAVALEQARTELDAVREKVNAAKQVYETTLAAGDDPRACRAEIDSSERELEDVARWVRQRETTYTLAYAKATAVRARLWKAASQDQLAHCRSRRADLQVRVDQMAGEVAAELLLTANLEAAFAVK